MTTFYADVSTYQNYLDDTYTRPFVMMRVSNESGNLDSNIALNLAQAVRMREAGKLVNFGGYILPGFTSNAALLHSLDVAGFPRDAVVMLDAESWGGKVAGDHSASFNALAESLRARQGGRADLVWGYGNRGDLAAIWPSRPSWLGIIVAAYSSTKPSVAGMVGWQYSDGEAKYAVPDGWPRASAPFGACDHNALFVPIPKPTGDDSMSAADVEKLGAQLESARSLLTAEVRNARAALANAIPDMVDERLEYQLPRALAVLRWGVGNAAYSSENAGALIDGKGLAGDVKAATAQPVDTAELAAQLASHLGEAQTEQLVAALKGLSWKAA